MGRHGLYAGADFELRVAVNGEVIMPRRPQQYNFSAIARLGRTPGALRPKPYGVRDLAAVYSVALILNVAVLVVFFPGIFLTYPASGVFLSRYIGQRVMWSFVFGTIENVAAAKRNMILRWPVLIPPFIVNAFVVKYL